MSLYWWKWRFCSVIEFWVYVQNRCTFPLAFSFHCCLNSSFITFFVNLYKPQQQNSTKVEKSSECLETPIAIFFYLGLLFVCWERKGFGVYVPLCPLRYKQSVHCTCSTNEGVRVCRDTQRALPLNSVEVSCGRKWVTDMQVICGERTNQTDLPKNWVGKVAWGHSNRQRRAGTVQPRVCWALGTNTC